MDKKVLLEILNTKYIEFTREEIMDIMNDELDKDPEDMDLELVDLCLDALEGKFDYFKDENSETNESQNKNLGKENPIELKRRITIKRIFIAVAVVALIACVSLGVYADQRNNNVSPDIVGYGDDCYEVNLNAETSNSENTVSHNELTETLKENGIENPVLPQVFFEDGCEMTDLTIRDSEHNDEYISWNVSLNELDIVTTVTITKYSNPDELLNIDPMVSRQFKSLNNYNVNGIYVLLFSNDRNHLIVYCKDSEKYQITLDGCDTLEAKNIVNSLG